MRYILYILLVLSVIACSEREKKELPTATEKIIENSSIDTVAKKEIKNTDLMELIKYIDSEGYINDTNLFKTTYNQNFTERKYFEGYYFYSYNFESTTLFDEYSWQLEWKTKNNENAKEEALNLTLFEKVNDIIAYHYINKKGNGYFCDGIIELWTFPESDDAKNAAEELSKHESYLFFNRGAYVGYKENEMYIFYSRSAGFYTPLKDFINYFSTTTNLVIPNKDIQRKLY